MTTDRGTTNGSPTTEVRLDDDGSAGEHDRVGDPRAVGGAGADVDAGTGAPRTTDRAAGADIDVDTGAAVAEDPTTLAVRTAADVQRDAATSEPGGRAAGMAEASIPVTGSAGPGSAPGTADLSSSAGSAEVGTAAGTAESSAPAAGSAEPSTAATGAAEPGGPAVDTAAGRRSLTLGRPAALGVAGALVLALVAAVTFGVLLVRGQATATASAEALATARAYAVTVTSYDHGNLDRNFADVLDGATGEFKDQYAGASAALRQLIVDAQASATGTVVDAGVRSAGPDEVVVLLFVDQSVSNALTPKPRIDRNRVLMTMTRQGDRWLVSRLELV